MQRKLTSEDKRKIAEMGYEFPIDPNQSAERLVVAVQCRYPVEKGNPNGNDCDIATIVKRLER